MKPFSALLLIRLHLRTLGLGLIESPILSNLFLLLHLRRRLLLRRLADFLLRTLAVGFRRLGIVAFSIDISLFDALLWAVLRGGGCLGFGWSLLRGCWADV